MSTKIGVIESRWHDASNGIKKNTTVKPLFDFFSDLHFGKGMDHVRGAPHHPQTQGKIERWHQTMKNRVLLENYSLPGDLERQVGAFVDHYNNHRYQESLANLTPADVYHGRGAKILKMREEIKKQTIQNRRLQHQAAAAQTETETEPEPPLRNSPSSPKNSDDGQWMPPLDHGARRPSSRASAPTH